ncbi:hypothetical protein SLA2020_239430 [Shorea laevis]
MELEGITNDVVTISMLIKCFCHLDFVNFGFSTLEKMLKIGVKLDIIIFNTLINGSCVEGKMLKIGVKLDLIIFNPLINGSCGTQYAKLLKQRGCFNVWLGTDMNAKRGGTNKAIMVM